jgi:hypothetical protein
LKASEYAWRGRHPKIFLDYLVKAVVADPLNVTYIAANTIKTIAVVSLPTGLKRTLMRLLGITRQPDSRSVR